MTTGALACFFFRILGKSEEEFIFLEFVFYKYKLSLPKKINEQFFIGSSPMKN